MLRRRRSRRHAGALARLEMELARPGAEGEGREPGLGAGLLIGAALFGFFAMGFGLTTIAVALWLVFDLWLGAPDRLRIAALL